MTRRPELQVAPVAVTMGDPSGIGPEIALRAWAIGKSSGAAFFLIADPAHMARTAADNRLAIPVEVVDPADIAASVREIFPRALPVLALESPVEGRPGESSPADARPTIEAIEKAVALIADGSASAMTTNPITKAALYRSGFRHPGHTEFLAELAERSFHVRTRPVMMLWCDELAVIPVTIHVALRDAIAALSAELIVETARIAAHDLREKFGIVRPRLAIAGVNPHAGESATMGTEDRDIVAPAVATLRALGIDARGPLPADTMFHAAARRGYDVAICMYHDQALIPIKTLAFDSGVNVTLGLPFIRTSPDHGTAYDIAGKGLARPDSLISALQLAARLASRLAPRQANQSASQPAGKRTKAGA